MSVPRATRYRRSSAAQDAFGSSETAEQIFRGVVPGTMRQRCNLEKVFNFRHFR